VNRSSRNSIFFVGTIFCLLFFRFQVILSLVPFPPCASIFEPISLSLFQADTYGKPMYERIFECLETFYKLLLLFIFNCSRTFHLRCFISVLYHSICLLALVSMCVVSSLLYFSSSYSVSISSVLRD